MSGFSGKVVLVTGGTSGIGSATARAFAAEGAEVVLSGRREREGRAVAEGIGPAAHFVRADVAAEDDVRRLVAEAVAKFGRLDVLFANAGVESSGPVTGFDVAEYEKVFGANVKGVFLTLKYAVPELLKAAGVTRPRRARGEVARLPASGWAGKGVAELGPRVSPEDVAQATGEALGWPVTARTVPRDRREGAEDAVHRVRPGGCDPSQSSRG